MFGFSSETKKAPLHGARIEDYAMIGDLQTAALVSRQGSIDWLCWPSFSSSACFAALLGTAHNGFWKIYPDAKQVECTRRYREGTMILESTYRTKSGVVKLTDCMPPRGKYSDIIRSVECLEGRVDMRMDMVLRFDYGLTVPWVTMHDHHLTAIAGPNMVVLRSICEGGAVAKLHGEGLTTVSEFRLKKGHAVTFTLTYASSTSDMPPDIDVPAEMANCEQYWRTWIAKSDFEGEYAEAVKRSLMVLKGLSYEPTGGMVAAVTTSLPEAIGGERNWDYRYCWLRDTAFVLMALMQSGYTDEALRWRSWLVRAVAGAPDQVQTMYNLDGERKLQEWTVDWLPGYEHSAPVRVGNAAAQQFQLDVFGEVAMALSRLPDVVDDYRAPALDLQARLVDHVCKVWPQPDDGIWEMRGKRRHFVHSKVMAWVALDRAIREHEKYDGAGDVKRWRKNRKMLREEILKEGFNKKLNSFTQSYGSKTVDASLLLILFVGFLPADDPRMVGTVAAIEKYLLRNGLVERYNTQHSGDGLKGKEGSFLACSFWLVTAWWLVGEYEKSRALFKHLLSLRNDVGLLSEEYDAEHGRMLGNFPQALSHIALVHTAFVLSDAWKPAASGR